MSRQFAGWILLAVCLPNVSNANPYAAPGDTQLRHDLLLLNDTGVIDIPVGNWPIGLGDVAANLESVDASALVGARRDALLRVQARIRSELSVNDVAFAATISTAANPREIRTFENTPRDEGEARIELTWLGNWLALNLAATYVANPFDNDEVRPDGTYVGVVAGNWMISAGWQDRWFGPGNVGSLILSSNTRPPPGVMIQRNLSRPFENRWLRWMGPWGLTGFMARLDDDRAVNDARLFGIRGSFKPLPGLEIGLTRTAQWCGDRRPCDLSTFGDLLVGNDNTDVNVAPEDEPGNQLGGFDIRWAAATRVPAVVYLQWIGEDGRGGGGAIGSWLRQAGIELHGETGQTGYRAYIEVSDTTCREGGFGFSGDIPDCAYEHGIYRTGYRYRGRSLGHGSDADSRTYSVGSTLVQSAGHTWNATLRYMEINRAGQGADTGHTVSPTEQDRIDIQLTHNRETRFGRIYAGVGVQYMHDSLSGLHDTDVSAFVQWSTQ